MHCFAFKFVSSRIFSIVNELNMLRFRSYPIAVILIAFNFLITRADEILGCGGFVKSHADIDFSKVEVEL